MVYGIRLILVFVVCGLSACVSTYVAPTSGPHAFLSVADSFHTTVALFDDAVTCKGTPKAIYPLFHSSSGFVTIPAEKLVTLSVVTTSELTEIPAYDTVTFIPETGAKYIVANQPIQVGAPIYRLQILKNAGIVDGAVKYVPLRYLKRARGVFACVDKKMIDMIQRI